MIIGGGFAGFWSAISAIRQGREIQKRAEVEITLVNPDNHVTILPGQNELSFDGPRFELDKYLKPLGINQVTGRAKLIFPEKNEVIVATAQEIKNLNYDYLVLASGGSLPMTDLPGIHHTFKVDSSGNAQRLGEHINELAKTDFHDEGASTFVVVGSGFAGLEVVTGIVQKARAIQAYHSGKRAEFKAILITSGEEIASSFPKECRQYIMNVIASRNISVITNAEPAIIGPASVLLNDGTRIATRTVIWAKGLVASSLTQFFKGPKDDVKRLVVNKFLKLPEYNNVIAAGNVAHTPGDNGRSSLIDCEYAQFEGRWAGHNAINDLFNMPLKEYVQSDNEMCIDLGELQASPGDNWEKKKKKIRYQETVAEKLSNMAAMYPWQNVEETVRASYPEIAKFKQGLNK